MSSRFHIQHVERIGPTASVDGEGHQLLAARDAHRGDLAGGEARQLYGLARAAVVDADFDPSVVVDGGHPVTAGPGKVGVVDVPTSSLDCLTAACGQVITPQHSELALQVGRVIEPG